MAKHYFILYSENWGILKLDSRKAIIKFRKKSGIIKRDRLFCF